MNETDLSRENRCVMCEDEQGSIGARCGERDGLRVHYFTQQRIGEYSERERESSTLMARDYKSASDIVVEPSKLPRKYIVRRLTPIECARLQGLPDWWAEGLGGSDSAKYKAYGNGLALPCAYDVMNRIARFVEWENTTEPEINQPT